MAAQGRQQDCYVLAKDEQWAASSLTSEEWLRQAPRGAYTTSRTVNGTTVLNLQQHIDRLASSARLMHEEDCKNGVAGALAFRQAAPALLTSQNLRPRILASLRAAALGIREVCSAHERELKLTTLLQFGPDNPPVMTHAALLPPLPTPPIKVQVAGTARSNASAKDSEWVRQRQALQDSKPPDVNEILLTDDKGGILEGMSSNVFILDNNGRIITPDKGILAGTVRDLVLQVCEAASIPVLLDAPKLDTADAWHGAFITSTSRLVLPVDSLQLPGGSVKHFGSSAVIDKLRARVAAEISSRSERFM